MHQLDTIKDLIWHVNHRFEAAKADFPHSLVATHKVVSS